MKTFKFLIPLSLLLLNLHLTFSDTNSSNKTVDTSIPKPKDFDYLVELFRIKTKWNGVNFSAFRTFTENVHGYVSVKKKNELFMPEVEEGFLTWNRNGFTVSGGKLAKRYGKCELYSSTAVYNPLFENWILWEKYGVGLSLEKRIKKKLINSAFTLDTRKSGAFHLLYKVAWKRFQTTFLSGTHVSLDPNLDDFLIFGTEQFVTYRVVRLHSVFKYEYRTHFGATDDPAVTPRTVLAGFLESRLSPVPFLDLTLLIHIRKTIKRGRADNTVSYGYVGELLFHKRFGIGQGFEFEKNNEQLSLTPETYVIVRLNRGRVSIKLNLVTKNPGESLLSGRGNGRI